MIGLSDKKIDMAEGKTVDFSFYSTLQTHIPHKKTQKIRLGPERSTIHIHQMCMRG